MNKHLKTNKGRKRPKSWAKQCEMFYGYRKAYRKSRFIKERQRYWIRGAKETFYPKYMSMDIITDSFYKVIENRNDHRGTE